MRTFMLLMFLADLICSCQKETGVILSETRTADDSTGILLVKRVIKYADATTTNDYSYDPNKKLVLTHTETTNNLTGTKQTSSLIFYRDDRGRVVKAALKYDQPRENILYDTIYTFNQFENTTSDKLVYSKKITSGNGIISIDSTTYQYNSNNQIIKTTNYIYSPNQQILSADAYYIWDYDTKGNLIQLRQYSNNAGNFELVITYQFRYDDKLNPMPHENSLIEWDWTSVSTNNVIEQKNIYPSNSFPPTPDEV